MSRAAKLRVPLRRANSQLRYGSQHRGSAESSSAFFVDSVCASGGWDPPAAKQLWRFPCSGCFVFGPARRRLDNAEGMATLKAMSSPRDFRPEQQNKLLLEPPIGVPDEQHAQVAADQRFQAALAQAIAAGDERMEAVLATVQLKRHTKLSV
jgi:hypothetical protein